MRETVVRYSEAFKLQVVCELEAGKLRNMKEAREVYGIGGEATVSRWLKKYGKTHLLRRIVRVQTPEDTDQIGALRRRIGQLEKALADAKVHEVLNRAYFEIVCEQFGVTDIEGLKKKLDARLSAEPGSSAKGR